MLGTVAPWHSLRPPRRLEELFNSGLQGSVRH